MGKDYILIDSINNFPVYISRPIGATSIGANSIKTNCEDDTLTFRINSFFDLTVNQRLEKVIEIVDKTTLDELISAVKALNEADYSKASWSNLQIWRYHQI